jgi:chromosome segregation ATPase
LKEEEINYYRLEIESLEKQVETKTKEEEEFKEISWKTIQEKEQHIEQLSLQREKLTLELEQERKELEESRELTTLKENEVFNLKDSIKSLEDTLQEKESLLASERQAVEMTSQQLQLKVTRNAREKKFIKIC